MCMCIHIAVYHRDEVIERERVKWALNGLSMLDYDTLHIFLKSCGYCMYVQMYSSMNT